MLFFYPSNRICTCLEHGRAWSKIPRARLKNTKNPALIRSQKRSFNIKRTLNHFELKLQTIIPKDGKNSSNKPFSTRHLNCKEL